MTSGGDSSVAFFVVVSDWHDAAERARLIRERVFVEEQGVPRELEWDEHDESARHALAFAENGRVVGTGRLLPDGHVGRMAVLRRWRGYGIGAAILRALLAEAAELGMTQLVLHAQTPAVGFYERFGFLTEGAQFMEAGIAHFTMRRHLPPE